MPSLACIVGCSGVFLTDQERAFFKEARPWGFILFKRNIETPDQLRALTRGLRETVGADAPIFIDQEGGRVQRMGPPHWPKYPPGRAYGRLFQKNATEGVEIAALGARLMAYDLKDVGIDGDCLPVLDIPVPGAHEVIGDRAYGEDAETVAVLGAAAAEGLLAGGVLPVIKHIPGHGRAGVDSHVGLPVVEASLDELKRTDFVPFHRLAHMPLAMTAHVVYTAIDPERPATTSRAVVESVIRGMIGFKGLLMSDDLSMEALQGSLAQRGRDAIGAGCDILLHCNGKLDEMQALAAAAPRLAGQSLALAEASLGRRKPVQPLDVTVARKRLTDAMASLAGA